MPEVLKWVGGVTAAGAWFYLVLEGKAPVMDFVDFLKLFLAGIGAYGLTVSGRGK